MRAAVLGSGDTALINKFEEWQSLNRQIARLYSTEKRGVKTLNSGASISYADLLYSLIWRPVDSLLLSDKYNLVYVSSTGKIEQLLRDKKVSTTLYRGIEGNEESFKALAGNNSPGNPWFFLP